MPWSACVPGGLPASRALMSKQAECGSLHRPMGAFDHAFTTVVLVEDDANLRYVTRRIIERECGLRVVGEARDGAEGVREVAAKGPSVVVLDLGMPVMDGFEALPLMLQASPASKIIVYSGRAPYEAEKRCLALGAYAYVEKDPSNRALVKALCRAMHDAAANGSCGCTACVA